MIRFIEVQALVLAPICPHWSEHVYQSVLGKPTIQHALWPTFTEQLNPSIEASATYIRELLSKIKAAEDAASKKRAKKGTAVEEHTGQRELHLFIANAYPAWQVSTIEILRECHVGKFDGSELKKLAECGLLKDKRVMNFVAMIKVIYFRFLYYFFRNL